MFNAPSYTGYHDEKYSYSRLRTPNNDPLFREIFKLLKLKKTDRILDYGCGAGDLTHSVSNIATDTIGVDINIDKAVARFPQNTFRPQIGYKMKYFKDGYFDKIIAINVIEHIHHFEKLLNELNRILKPGGKIFITTYDTKFILHSVLYDPTHVIEWDKSTFENLLSQHFTIEKSFKSGSFFNYIPFNKIIVRFLKPELCIVATKDK
jgi:ubiquinone/menaquinone biosynthesis C-methylase UbiE